MRFVTRPGLALAIAVAIFALPTIASGALSSPAAPASNSVTYQDSTGEDPEGLDITAITVSNDDTGLITFRINVPNRPTLGQDMLFEIWVDSDANIATGSPELAGVDYVMQLVRGEINLYKWDGTDFTRRFGDPPAITLSQSYDAGLTVKISASELGNTKKLNFFVVGISGLTVDPLTGEIDDANAHVDVAPGGGAGLYPYEVKITPPTLVVKKLTRSPAKPKAGKPFTLRLIAARSDTNAVIQNGRVTCVGKVANKRVKPQVARVVRGAATCTWNIPSSASRKTFRGTVTVAFEGLKASQSYTSKIRR
ncbi:MAG TPA: hypothetical protein VLA22_10460 [Gaiellaceae bacterium]|nr:hypothetical protein [Gaiellaceae bacterium]